MHSLLILLVCATLTLAQNARQTLSLFLLDTNETALVASVVTANPTETAFAIGCAPGIATSDCAYAPTVTITEGYDAAAATSYYRVSAVLDGTATDGGAITASAYCSVGGTTSASCTGSAGTDVFNATLAATDVTFFPVVITAGQEKLAAATATASTTATTTTTTTSDGGATSTSGTATATAGSTSAHVSTSNTASAGSASASAHTANSAMSYRAGVRIVSAVTALLAVALL
ncbi:hypothetical protein LTR66_001826 [Elasticomyces elasticus]|nr:hypothetical protein LTR66_001826 [Elasticomyces elasticus]KAK5008005.1 hypothetical protein LTR28_004567 [Elasticomyces elasticus]